MITINGKKMGKSLGNFITLNEFFSGKHELLNKAYSPMTIRFFILQAHYRSTLDFSNEALLAAEKAYLKIINGLRALNDLNYEKSSEVVDETLVSKIKDFTSQAFAGLNDDMNSAVAIAQLFNLLRIINNFRNGVVPIGRVDEASFDLLKKNYQTIVVDIFGLIEEQSKSKESFYDLMDIVVDSYKQAKTRKDYDQVDSIRKALKNNGILIKDGKTAITWDYEE
jgi:cysteinyl-tRNA synthetase